MCKPQAVLQHRKLVLLLDYDGTLTPIVNDPSKALLSDRVSESPTHGHVTMNALRRGWMQTSSVRTRIISTPMASGYGVGVQR